MPVPIGGGLIIVLVINLFIFTFYFYLYEIPPFSFIVGLNLIWIISWLDDIYSISSFRRFLIHIAAATTVINGFGFFEQIYIPFLGVVNLGFSGLFVTFFWIIWLTNAFNFMDGIDGIAGTQAFTAGIGWLLVSFLFEIPFIGLLAGVIAFSNLGFLIHNWQPAKIFMGDVGSASLGFCFAVIPLLAKDKTVAEYQVFLPIISVMLVWMFVFDSIYTFIKRLFKFEKLWEAHREHIYQRLTIRGMSHQRVTIIYGLISGLFVVFTFLGIKLFLIR